MSLRNAVSWIAAGVIMLGGINTANAGGHLEVCNRGTVNVDVAEIDWYGLMGENPDISGWYSLDVGQCYHKDGLGVDVSLAFESSPSHRTAYFYFDALRIENEGPIGSPLAGSVETTSRIACVDFAHTFDRRTTEDQFGVCPAGWRKILFSWHVTTCGELRNCSLSLDIHPSLDQQKPLSSLERVNPP